MAKSSSRLIFSPTSLADLQRINEFYTKIDPKVCTKALSRLSESLQVIENYPEVGREIHIQNIHEFLVPFGKGNFFIRYQLQKKKIHIAHIWHSLEDEVQSVKWPKNRKQKFKP